MKRILSCVLTVLLGFATVLSFAGCNKNTKGADELWITYFKGGYGDIWINELARKFEAENPDVKIKLAADTLLIDSVGGFVENGTTFDLIFCHDLPWENWAAKGYLENLTELYDTEVENGIKLADRILNNDVLASAKYRGDYWKVPWTVGTAGMAYNISVLRQLDEKNAAAGVTSSWAENPPATYTQLIECCKQITAANLKYGDEMSPSTVTPFIWSGLEEQWQWDYVVFDWWAQMAGVDAINNWKVFNEPGYATASTLNPDVEVYNPNKYAKANNNVGWGELKDAYALWYNLIASNKTWSHSSVSTLDKDSNQAAFVSGAAAFMPSACWIEYEARDQLKASGNEIAIMPTPVVDGVYIDGDTINFNAPTEDNGGRKIESIRAESTEANTKTVNGVTYKAVSFTNSFGDTALIPSSSSGKEFAKRFLLFMAKEENADLFTKLSGGTVLPYKSDFKETDGTPLKTLDYSKVNFVSGLANGYTDTSVYAPATKWQQNIWSIASTTTKFNTYTQHPLMLSTDIKGTAKMNSVWPENKYHYKDAFTGVAGKTPTALFDKFYSDFTKNNNAQWNYYKNQMTR